MTLNLCIIGNSHVACVKQAYENTDKKIRIDFFASAANTCEDIRNINGFLVPQNEHLKNNFILTSGGINKINISEYSHIIIYGLFPYETNMLKLYRAENSDVFYSKAVLDSMNVINESIALKIFNEIRKTSNIPVFCSSRPYLTKIQNQSSQLDLYPKLRSFLLDKVTVFDNFTVFFQPEITTEDIVFTKKKYNKGAKHYDKRYSDFIDGDRVHMNEEFGLEWLSYLLTII